MCEIYSNWVLPLPKYVQYVWRKYDSHKNFNSFWLHDKRDTKILQQDVEDINPTTHHSSQWQTAPSAIQSIIFGGLRHLIPMDTRSKYQGIILKCEGDKQSRRFGEVWNGKYNNQPLEPMANRSLYDSEHNIWRALTSYTNGHADKILRNNIEMRRR